MSTIDTIRKINKKIVHDNGTIDSFDRQLLDLTSGIYDTRFPFVIKLDTNSLKYIDSIDVNEPLIMMVSTAVKIREKHDIGYSYVSRVNELLEKSIFAFDSLKHKSSILIVLGEFDENNNPIIAVCRSDKKIGVIGVNEVTSIYDRSRFINLLQRTYQENNKFYINNKMKTEQFINSFHFTMLDDLRTALSTSYFRQTFTKSQVEQDIRDGLQVERCVDENVDYRLIQCANGSMEIRDYDDELVAETEYDNLDEALEELQNENDLQI